jgi:hypothetical protein
MLKDNIYKAKGICRHSMVSYHLNDFNKYLYKIYFTVSCLLQLDWQKFNLTFITNGHYFKSSYDAVIKYLSPSTKELCKPICFQADIAVIIQVLTLMIILTSLLAATSLPVVSLNAKGFSQFG